jgi:hypothetical protein
VFFSVFILGGLFCTNAWQPYTFFAEGVQAAGAVLQQRLQVRPELVRKRRYDGEGVTCHDPRRAQEGLTLLQGIFPEGIELRLVDLSGQVVNRWPADLFGIWPHPDHIFPAKNIPADDFHYHTQGMWLYPDGTVVFNFAEKGTVKLDRCGKVIWTVDRMTHHAVTPAPDGSVWIPVKGDVRRIPDKLLFPGISRERLLSSDGWYEDRLLKVGADGHMERELSVLQALFDAGLEQQLFDAAQINAMDPTHVNDIELVTATLAGKIEGVSAGDLLVSIRQMHMLAILSRGTGDIKWHHVGPWTRQHDPDITEAGTIEVFNNRYWNLNRMGIEGSNLVSLDPATRETRVLYPPSGANGFSTDIMGTHQLLANGNRLIAESMAGRVFEVDPNGQVVWEYVAPYDETHASVIEGAIRYGRDYFTVKDWRCATNADSTL